MYTYIERRCEAGCAGALRDRAGSSPPPKSKSLDRIEFETGTAVLTEEGRQKNRRVEFKIETQGSKAAE